MINLKFFLVLLLSISLLCSPANARVHGGAPVPGNLIPLNGINVSGLEDSGVIPGTPGVNYFVPCDSAFGTQNECPYYALRGVKLVRLPFLWERIEDALDGPLDQTYLGFIENFLDQAQANGFKVMVDMHNSGSGFGGKIGCSGGPTYAQYAYAWGLIAQALNGYPALAGYDEMNEPSYMCSHVNVPTMYQAATTSIRQYDMIHAVYLEGDGYATAWGWTGLCPTSICGGAPTDGWGPGGNNDLLNVYDPANDIIFEAHAYGDWNGSGEYPTYPNPAAVGCTQGQTSYQCAQTMMDVLTDPPSTLDTNILHKRHSPFVGWCNTNQVKCDIGETGVSNDDPAWLIALDIDMKYLQANGVTLTYWSAGPDFINYNLGVEPQNLGLTNQQDTVQMSVLTKYSGGMTPSNYFISGPNRGSASVPSTPFTITYYGYITTPITFTPSDNGAGGTFIPSTVTCGAGFNCSMNFTYTALGTDAYSISVTNGIGLVNPPAMGYATVADLFSTNSISDSQIENVISVARKIYAPYNGPAINLRKVTGSITTTADFNYTSMHLYAPLDTATIQTWNGASETDTLASTTVTVAGAGNFGTDSGVIYTSGGTPLTWIPPSAVPSGTGTVTVLPAQGQYQVTNGTYTFNAADIGSQVTISYLYPTYVVTVYDQSPLKQNMGIVQFDSTPLLTDQPLLQLRCNNGPPCIVFNGSNRMDMVSPVSNNTQQTVMNVVAPNQHLGGNFMGWDWTACPTPGVYNCLYDMTDDILYQNDGWQVTNMNNGYIDSAGNGGFSRFYTQDYTFTAIANTFTASTTGGFRTFNNGELTGQNDTGSPLYLGYGRVNATVGYERGLSPNWIGKLSENIVLNSALANTSIQSFHSNQDSFFGLNYNGNYTPFAPTLSQNTDTANTPPWGGLNEGGALGTFGYTTTLITPMAVRTIVPYNAVTTDAGNAYYANDVGLNLVRLGVIWEALEPNLATGSTTLDPTNLALLDSAVTSITSRKLDAMIDIHNYGYYAFSGAATVGTGNGTVTSFSTTISSTQSSILPMNNCGAGGEGQTNYSQPTLTYTVGGITTSTSWTSSFYCNGANPRTFYDATGNINTASLNVTTGAFSITFNHPPDTGTPIYITWTASQSWTNNTYNLTTYYADFLGLLASHYASNPKVLFDLMNEPEGTAASLEVPVEQGAINAIRTAGNTNYIMAQFGPSYSACSDVVSAFFHGTVSGTTLTVTTLDGGFSGGNGSISVRAGVSGASIPANTTILSQLSGTTGGIGTYQLSSSATISSSEAMASGDSGPAYNSLTDSQNKLSNECHQYLSTCGTDGCGDYAPKGSALSAFNGNISPATTMGGTTKYCSMFGCKLLWGEYNSTYTQQTFAELKTAYDLFAANPTLYYGWTEYAGGPAWPESYYGLIEPREYPTPYARRGQTVLENTYATGHVLPCNKYASGSSGPCDLTTWPYSTQIP